ncbi:DUF5958 family protein [Streptomyces coeruleorubidus]|uniref:DUF5958 family protein n=1 Tax=Streptomyces coeruleorubidus TaxID=116188 RepID=UPI0033C2B462
MILNELAQGLRPIAEGVEWFEALPEDEQRKVLHALVLFCGQARACEEDVPESIARSGIRPTHTPAVMLTRWRFGMERLQGEAFLDQRVGDTEQNCPPPVEPQALRDLAHQHYTGTVEAQDRDDPQGLHEIAQAQRRAHHLAQQGSHEEQRHHRGHPVPTATRADLGGIPGGRWIGWRLHSPLLVLPPFRSTRTSCPAGRRHSGESATNVASALASRTLTDVHIRKSVDAQDGRVIRRWSTRRRPKSEEFLDGWPLTLRRLTVTGLA